MAVSLARRPLGLELTCCSSVQMLDQRQILVTRRVVTDAADHIKTQLLIEARRLEIMGFKNDLPALSSLRFHFNGAHQPCTLALPAHAFGDKEIADIAGPSPVQP